MAADPMKYFRRPSDTVRIIKKTTAPGTTDINHPLGTMCLNTTSNVLYWLVDKANSIATWNTAGSGQDFQGSILKQTAVGGAVASEGNRYLCNSTGGGWTDTYIYEYESGAWVETIPTDGMIVFDEETNGYLLYNAGAWGSFTTGITTIAAATDTNITGPTGAQILIWDNSNSWDNKAVSGDVAITTAGVTTVTGLTFGSDAQGDLAVRGAASWGRVSFAGDGNIGIGDGTDFNSVAVTGDVAITNAGVTTVTGITLGSDAQGDVYYRGAAALGRLAAGAAGQSLLSGGAGADPYWGAPTLTSATSLANNCTLNDAGANDAILSFTTQTVGAPTLTVPDFASVNDTFCFVTLSQTLANKTLTSPVLNTGLSGTAFLDEDDMASDSATKAASQQSIKAYVDSGTVTMTNKTLTAPKIVTTGYIADGGGDELLYFLEDTTPVNYIVVTNADTGVSPSLTAGGSDANVDILIHGKATGNVQLADGTDPTKIVDFEMNGATTAKTMTFTCSHTDDRAITFPDATDTLVGKATTDTFTNKTYDCDGSGNAFSNLNADELDPVAVPSAGDASDTVYGMEFTLYAFISNQAAAVNIYSSNAPFKFEVIDAWSIATSANGGTWKLNNGAAGAGTDITNAVAVAGSDTDIDRPTTIDDAAMSIASGGSLSIVPDGGGALDAKIFIKCIRVD